MLFAYTEKKLARDMARAAKAIEPNLKDVYEAERSSLELYKVGEPDAPPYAFFLGNLFRRVRNLPRAERRAIVDDFVKRALSPPELTRDELLASLALRVRTPFEFDLRMRMVSLGMDDPPTFTTASRGGLLLELIADNPETVRSVSLEDLAEADVSPEQALEIARAALAAATDERQWQQVAENVWASSYDDDYDLARIAADVDAARWPFAGAPILYAPSHSVCLATDRTDGGTLENMVRIGDERAADHRPLSQRLWIARDGGLHALSVPEADGEAARILEQQSFRERMSEYGEQKGYLEEALRRREEDSYVAEYTVYETGGALRSFATYTINLPTYLPRAERVALVEHTGGEFTHLGFVAWDTFADILGGDDFVRFDNLEPERYQLTHSLSDARIARLKSALEPE